MNYIYSIPTNAQVSLLYNKISEAQDLSDILQGSEYKHLKTLGDRMRYCSITFNLDHYSRAGDDQRGVRCKNQLCPICLYFKRGEFYHRFDQWMDYIKEKDSSLVPVHLTFALDNCKAKGLRDHIDFLQRCINNFFRREFIASRVKGSIKYLEVVGSDGKYYPHYHVIVLLTGSGYDRGSVRWRQAKLEEIWLDVVSKLSTRYTYPVGCYIYYDKHIDNVLELSTYAMKSIRPKDYYNDDLTDLLINTKGYRKVVLTGLFRRAAAYVRGLRSKAYKLRQVKAKE